MSEGRFWLYLIHNSLGSSRAYPCLHCSIGRVELVFNMSQTAFSSASQQYFVWNALNRYRVLLDFDNHRSGEFIMPALVLSVKDNPYPSHKNDNCVDDIANIAEDSGSNHDRGAIGLDNPKTQHRFTRRLPVFG